MIAHRSVSQGIGRGVRDHRNPVAANSPKRAAIGGQFSAIY
jgi:hypothetical protein